MRTRRLLIGAAAVAVLGACIPGAERPNIAGNQPMPQVAGLSQEEATHRLESLGVNVEVQQRQSPTHQTGQVTDALPRPGTPIGEGDTVSIVVAENPGG